MIHEEPETPPSRRDFLKGTLLASGAYVIVNSIGFANTTPDSQRVDAQPRSAPPAWKSHGTTAPYRYDGLAKVMGHKIYARDLHARDLKGWPQNEQRVVFLRAHHADRLFLGADLDRIQKDLGVTKVITGESLDSSGFKPDGMYVNSLMVRPGTAARHLGQVAALLYFPDNETYLDAHYKLIDTSPYLRYGDSTPPTPVKPYGQSRIVRYTDASGREEFSYAKDGSFAPPWEAPDPKGSVNARAAYYAELIKKDLENPAWHRFKGKYVTQGVDPMFMEPECGLAWYDPPSKTLHLTWGTQSPLDDADACVQMLSASTSIKVERVVVNSCYPGGGFGGRDRSDFPLYLAMAAALRPGQAIRIVNNRFDQFQSGLKRHPAETEVELAIDQDGRFQVFHNDLKLDGGGQNNYSFAVQNVGARNASSAYAFPKSWVDSQSTYSVAVPAGSMRGFGSFQSAFAMECLVDEAAEKLKVDPIELRLKNIITDPVPVHTGTTPRFRIHSDLLLQAAQKSPLWVQREADRKARSNADRLYGVGFAVAVKSYGKNPGDACPATVMIDTEGRLSLETNSIDMGNGSATTLSLCLVSILGSKADSIAMGVTTSFEALELVSNKPASQEQQDEFARNPRWVPNRAISTAASASAYQMRHAVQEAARVLLRFGLWPAALAIWGKTSDELPWNESALVWNKGALQVPNHTPIPLKTLAREAHARRFVTGAMIHAFYRADWAKAQFQVDGQSLELPIDALAVRRGQSAVFKALDRQNVQFPPLKNLAKGADVYTPYAVIVAVEVDRKSGEVKVVAGETFLECGEIIQRDIVEGQMEGAFAMGIGQALTEHYPLTTDGPGQGGWNLHRYQVPKARDCALNRVKFNIVTPTRLDPPKGMAEVVFNSVPPAIVNAVAHATGRRFYQLPLRAQTIKEALS
jgi:CO/xanthine dehydrogenase Mo-binding subunit